MRALVLSRHGHITLEERPVPRLAEGEALVRVRCCGICGSDLGMVYEHAHFYPLVPGHEFTGAVAGVAGDVGRDMVGMPVTAYPVIGCGTCPQCRRGDRTKCARYDFLGSRSDGAFADYVKVPVENLIPLQGLDERRGALIEPLAVAVHAVRRATAGSLTRTAVIGAGPIGLLTALAADALGAVEVVMAEIDSRKAELARSMGLRAVCTREAGIAALEEFFPRGATAVFECSGTGPGIRDALSAAAPDAAVVMVGIHKRDVVLPPDCARHIMKKELQLTGAWVSNYLDRPADDWATALELIRSGRVDVAPLITQVLPPERGAEAFADLHDHPGAKMKTLICFSTSEKKEEA